MQSQIIQLLKDFSNNQYYNDMQDLEDFKNQLCLSKLKETVTHIRDHSSNSSNASNASSNFF